MVGQGQAVGEELHFWEWKQSMSSEYSQRKQHVHPYPSEAAVAWVAAENFVKEQQVLMLQYQDPKTTQGAPTLKCSGPA